MFKRFNVIKKMLAILMSVIVCSTSTMLGYADENFENSSVDEISRGIENLNDGVDYEENNFEVNARAATATDVTPTEATPIDAILKDENGNLISGKWKCENGIILELADKVLTISGNGVLKADAGNIIRKIRGYKCIINEGITGISKIFSGGKTGASTLESIELPNSITRIESEAFRGCPSLSSIKMSTSITYIGDNAFGTCLSLSSIEIPASVTYIANNAFHTCNSLTTITNNSSYTLNLSSIHSKDNNGWYLKNTGIIVDKIANGQTAICIKKGEATPTDAMLEDKDGIITSGKWKCENGITIELADNVLEINGNGIPGEDVKNTIMKTICKSDKYKVKCVINNGITKIPNSLFLDCKGLSEIEIPNGVTNIGNEAFSGCSNLNSIKIPSSVTNIGQAAFSNCRSLSDIEIPNGVTSIGKEAFYYCDNLSSIEISSSVTNIDKSAFTSCNSLSSIKVAQDNKVYDSRENCNALIETETNALIKGSSNTKIPNGVEVIGYGAFTDCKGLSEIEIPSSVTNIAYTAFSGCGNLSSIKVAQDNKVYDSRENCNAIIKTETNELIAGCYNTKIPNSVEIIGYGAFLDCSNLTAIEIPSSITRIDTGKSNPFDGCKKLKRFTNNSSVNYFLNQSIHGYGENGQWYLENTDTVVNKIANGQTAIYKKIGEDGKPVEDVKYGDINSDGSINIQDGVLLKKHLAGIKGLNIDMTASDVNVDGQVNIQDAVILLKHLAGMNVTMGKE